MKIGFIVLLWLPIILFAQTQGKQSIDTGVHFDYGINWQQLLKKAKEENKYVFIDCYTTWCGPCKQMEKEVYPLEKVGTFFNEHFISVKMQMDSSAKDNDETKASYADAHHLNERYKIVSYPGYLFFTSDGKLLNRDVGLRTPEDFIALAANSIDPAKNYYMLLDRFHEGKTNLNETSFLARQALLLGDTLASQQIAKQYILHLKKDSLFTRSNIEFMYEFTKNSKDKGFAFFYQHADSIDKIMSDDIYVQNFVQRIIYKEIVVPEINKADHAHRKEPDWHTIDLAIQKKYDTYYAGRVVTAARSSWAGNHNNDKEYLKYLVEYQNKFGTKNNIGTWVAYELNHYAWQIFQLSNNKAELSSALSWSSRAVLMFPSAIMMDTYANLLYKLGRKEDAVTWEGIAAKLFPANKEIQETLAKMKNNEPTWTKKEN